MLAVGYYTFVVKVSILASIGAPSNKDKFYLILIAITIIGFGFFNNGWAERFTFWPISAASGLSYLSTRSALWKRKQSLQRQKLTPDRTIFTP